MPHMRSTGFLLRGVFAGLILFCSHGVYAISFQFNYIPAGGVGFDDPVFGTARRSALEQAANQFGGWFNHNATITLDATSTDDPGSSTLASAISEFVSQGPGFGFSEVAANKAIFGNDLNGGSADGVVDVNWGNNWEVSANPADVSVTEYDFYSTIYHELAHVLGFLTSSFDGTGTDLFGFPPPNPGEWTYFDQFVVDGNGNTIVDPATFILNQGY